MIFTRFKDSLRSSFVVVVAGMGFRATLQAILTVLLARFLGKMDYGVCVIIGTVAGFFSVWAGFGAAVLHLRDTAIEPQTWKRSFVARHRGIWKTQPLLCLLALITAWLFAGNEAGLWIVVLLVVGDLFGVTTTELMVRSCQGRARYRDMAVAMCMLPFARVGFLLVHAVAFPPLNLASWSMINFITGVLMATFVAVVAAKISIRKNGLSTLVYSQEYIAGISFSLAAASSKIHADADKAIIAKLSSFGSAGEYSLAYRVMDVLLLPINGMIESSMLALFRHGQRGLKESIAALWRRWVALLGLALCVCLIAYAVSSALPLVFGDQYEEIVTIARWLCLLPLTTAAWMLVRSIMSTTNNQKLVGIIEMLGALLSILMGVGLVTCYGWKGAVVATYGTHLVMMLAALACAFRPVHLTQNAK